MENKNRNLLVVLIAIVIIVAVFSSFGLSLYNSHLPEIQVPEPVPSQIQTPAPSDGREDVIWVEVTPQTVQEVVATLSPRTGSYYREIRNVYEGGQEITARVWVDGGWTKTEAPLPTGAVRHTLVGGDILYYWYEGDRSAKQAPADQKSQDLDGPRIPTYEEILWADLADISDTGYQKQGGLDCVYVQVEDRELGYQHRYWISVDSGLLVAAETLKEEQVVLSMSSYTLEQPVAAGTEFALPDGTVLHTAS